MADRNEKPQSRQHHDSNPKTKPGQTGFPQEYNEEPSPAADLNPDAVTEDSVLPEPREQGEQDERPAKSRRVVKRSRK